MKTPFVSLFLFVSLLLPYSSFSSPETAALSSPITIIPNSSESDNSSDKTITWTLSPVGNNLKSTLTVSFSTPSVPSDNPETWEYSFLIDEMNFFETFYGNGLKKTNENMLPLHEIFDGTHTITLNLRDPEGKLHTQDRSFKLDTKPVIQIAWKNEDDNIINPDISLSFIGANEDEAGSVDIFLDQNLLISTTVQSDQNKKQIPLSTLIGKQLLTSDLYPGQHLLSVDAISVTGTTAHLAENFFVKTQIPKLFVKNGKNNLFDSLVIEFPKSENDFQGSITIYYQQSAIISTQATKNQIQISRKEIRKALTDNGHDITDDPMPLAIAAESATLAQNWIEINFN